MKTKTYNIPQVGLYLKEKIDVYERPVIATSKNIYDVAKSIAYFNHHSDFKEMIYMMCLNRANRIIGITLLAEGHDGAVVFSCKQIAQAAILQNANGVVLFHNHPSGKTEPSYEDVTTTIKCRDALKLFDITLLDHLVVSEKDYYSLADEGRF